MDPCKNFSKQYPLLMAVLAFAFMFCLLKLMNLVPDGPLDLGIRETILAAVIYTVTFLFMGKEKVSFSTKGFGYAFRLLRGYYIFLVLFSALCIVSIVLEKVVINHEAFSYPPIRFINILLAGLFVGIVEEFIFRGLIFGSLLQKFGNAKKSIILAAVISGLAFGVLHVLGSVLAGEITNMGAVITAVLKTIQCGIFGVVLAFIYYKTRNLFVVAALHSLDDFILFVVASLENMEVGNYVSTDGDIMGHVIAYGIFTLILVPTLVRSIRDITPGEAIPFDDDFAPRKVAFIKKSKKKKSNHME